jgi:predicted acetyltransferase
MRGGSVPDRWLHWMPRLVDVPAALAARKYHRGVETGVELTVTDASLPLNAGAYRLRAVDGQGVVETVRSASAVLDVLERLFAGPRPWMPDGF